MLWGARRRDPDPERVQVVDGSDGARVGRPDQQSDRRRRREPEDEPGRLARRPEAEAQHRLECRRREIGLALGQRLGGSRFGPGRLERDGQPLEREVALGLGNPDGKVFR